MTLNKLWDSIINPNANVELIESKNGLHRGIKISYTPSDELNTKDKKTIIVEETESNNISTNYKNARMNMINEVKKIINK